MKIALFLNKDYNFAFDMMNDLIPKLKAEHDISGIVFFPDKLAKYKGGQIYFAYLRMFGLGVFLKLSFRMIFKRLSVFISYAFRKSKFYTFEGMCRHHGLQIHHFQNPNERQVVEWVKDSDTDIILIFVGNILKREILESPKVCTLNKHSSLLPAYKGLFPVFWSMMNNDKIGVSIHKVNENIDEGEVVLQKVYGKYRDWSVYDFYRLIYSQLPSLIMESLRLVTNKKQEKVQHNMPNSYFSLPTRNDYSKFRKLGYVFV